MGSKNVYTLPELTEAVKNADSVTETIRLLGKTPTGSRHNYVSSLIKKHNLDTSHFTYTKTNLAVTRNKRKTAEQILVLRKGEFAIREKGHFLTRALLEIGVPYECNHCGNSQWMGKPMTLDVDHIDGNPLDCRKENLRFLCPNCHRQTPTFGKQKTISSDSLTCSCGREKTSKAKTCIICYSMKKSAAISPLDNIRKCLDCPNKLLTKTSLRCPDCYYKTRRGADLSARKIIWPENDELITLIQSTNFIKAAKHLGVSDNAIRKHLRKEKYDLKTFKKIS